MSRTGGGGVYVLSKVQLKRGERGGKEMGRTSRVSQRVPPRTCRGGGQSKSIETSILRKKGGPPSVNSYSKEGRGREADAGKRVIPRLILGVRGESFGLDERTVGKGGIRGRPFSFHLLTKGGGRTARKGRGESKCS